MSRYQRDRHKARRSIRSYNQCWIVGDVEIGEEDLTLVPGEIIQGMIALMQRDEAWLPVVPLPPMSKEVTDHLLWLESLRGIIEGKGK